MGRRRRWGEGRGADESRLPCAESAAPSLLLPLPVSLLYTDSLLLFQVFLDPATDARFGSEASPEGAEELERPASALSSVDSAHKEDRSGMTARAERAVAGGDSVLVVRRPPARAPPPPLPPRTEWTRRVPHPVLGHAASLATPSPSARPRPLILDGIGWGSDWDRARQSDPLVLGGDRAPPGCRFSAWTPPGAGLGRARGSRGVSD